MSTESQPVVNVTGAIADQTKAIERQRKLVAKRGEMLEAAYRIQAEADYRVTRREEILAEHQAVLADMEAELSKLQATSEEASQA